MEGNIQTGVARLDAQMKAMNVNQLLAQLQSQPQEKTHLGGVEILRELLAHRQVGFLYDVGRINTLI
jgi:hypothetical protein